MSAIGLVVVPVPVVVVVVGVVVVARLLRVQLTELVAFATLATNGVVAAFHVVDGGVLLVAGGFVGARAAVVVLVLAVSVRPAVGPDGVRGGRGACRTVRG